MGTGSSKKRKEEDEEKDKVGDIQPMNVRTNRRQGTNPAPSHVGLQPMRRYGKQKTMIPSQASQINNPPIQESSNSQKKYFKKSSADYLLRFKQQFQTGDSNTFLSHLTDKVSQSNEITLEHLESIRKRFMPQYVFDWKLELDPKTGEKTWKNNGKIKLNEDIMKEFKNILYKPIGASEKFYKKRAWLFHFLALSLGKTDDNSKLLIDKKNIFENTFNEFKKIKDIKVKLPMRIIFLGEEDQDEGGMNKYWYTKLFDEIFSKEKKLFRENPNECIGKKSLIFYPKYKGMNLEYYEFFGKLILKSFFDRVNIKGFNFNNIVLNPILNRKVTLEDIKYYDINLYKKLKLINDSTIKGNKELEKYKFVWKTKDENNKEKEVELIENGKNTFLNDENKNKFIEKVIYQETIAPYEEQIKYLHSGVFPILDDNLKGIFSTDELNFLLHGQNKIDLNDWKENTDYKGDYNENHQLIKMFWNKMGKLKPGELLKFLTFSTWLNNIPIDGFGNLKGAGRKVQKFTIEPYINYSNEEEEEKYVFRPMESKPSFNRLILPQYPNEKEMDKAFEIILKGK